VIILINGIEGAGKGETVKLLNEWMDPRLIEVRTFDQQTDEELARPPAWRATGALPAKGRMAVLGNWYSQMLQSRVHGETRTRGSTGDRRRRAPEKDALRRRRADLQVLVPPVQEADEGAAQGAGRRPAAQLAHQPAGLAAIGDLRQVRANLASACCAAPAATTRPGT
jgi:hypothetical protein